MLFLFQELFGIVSNAAGRLARTTGSGWIYQQYGLTNS